MENEEKFLLYNKYIHFPKISNSRSQQKLVNSSSTDFVDRNYNYYLIKKINRKRSLDNLMKQDDLNLMLFKLKNYYNDIITINKDEELSLKKLKIENDKNENKYKNLLDSKNLIIPNEKISFNELENLKYTSEEIENKIFGLLNQKQELDFKLKNEIEYSKTIEYMFEDEKEKIQKIHEETLEVENKLDILRKHKKILDKNLIKQQEKRKNSNNLLQKIEKDIHLILNFINSQDKKSKEVDDIITKRELENNEMKNNMKHQKEKNIIEFNTHKENTINLINKANEQQIEKIEKEKNYIKTILCLNLIQKFFIYKKEFNYNELIESKDYKNLIGDIFIIKDENDNIIFNSKIYEFPFKKEKIIRISNEKSFNETINEFHHFKKNNSNDKKILSKSLSNLNIKNKKNRIKSAEISNLYYTKMDLSKLIEKFNEIKFTKDEIFEYNSKMMNKIKFYQDELMNYNNKIILYENKKDKFKKKVNEIISKDYKNFYDLIINNSKFENFIKKNIDSIKHSEEKENEFRKSKVNFFFTSQTSNKKPIEMTSIELYKNCHKLIRENKNFFKEILINLKNLIDLYSEIAEISNEKYNKILEYSFKIDNFIEPKFLDYIHELYNYVLNNENIKEKFDMDYIYKTLINPFYKDKNEKDINIDFYNQFQSKKINKEYEILYNFSFLNETIENIKIISDLIKDIKKLKLTPKRLSEVSIANIISPRSSSGNILQKSPLKKNSLFNNFLNSSKKTKYSHYMKKFNFKNLSQDIKDLNSKRSLEEEQSDNDTETTQPEIRIKPKNINNSIDAKIIKNLYDPFLNKTFYARDLNSNLKKIKLMSSYNSKNVFSLKKREKEINELSNQIVIYNNPLLNVNNLSNPTYNYIIGFLFSNNKKNKKIIKKKIYKNKKIVNK